MVRKGTKEQALLRQIVRGNTIAMKEFYTIYSGYLTAVCSRYVSNEEDVKDILQESFIKIFKAVERFEYKGEGSLKAWSARIVVNEALKHIKENQKLKVTNLPSWDLPDMTDDQEPDFEDIPTSAILDMIRTLPVGYRTVFNLYVFEEKSHKEIAQILGIAENSSASQLHRAKRLLIKEIESYRIKKMAL
ncbi:MAG: RNA polymerase sigma factor [Proteiniphilum sp.]|nr:RNA polymerase sigma factor [Proteiniphilum sp.]